MLRTLQLHTCSILQTFEYSTRSKISRGIQLCFMLVNFVQCSPRQQEIPGPLSTQVLMQQSVADTTRA